MTPHSIRPSDTVALCEGTSAREFDGEWVVLDLNAGNYFGLDDVGGKVWQELAALVGLVFDPNAEAPALTPLRGQDAFAMVSRSIIRFAIDDPAAQLREFEQLRILVRRCSVFELRRPLELAQLESSAGLVSHLLPHSSAKSQERK